MITKGLSPLERVQPCFIEPMQVAPVRTLPDGGAGPTRPSSTAIAALQARRLGCSGRAVVTGSPSAFRKIAGAWEKLPSGTLAGEVMVLDEKRPIRFYVTVPPNVLADQTE